MKHWSDRSDEVAYLLNPIFCCILLTAYVKDYTSINSEGMPFPLIFMILPIILHQPTMDALPRSISKPLIEWIEENPLESLFYKRVISMKPFTREALQLGIMNGWLFFDEHWNLHSNISVNNLKFNDINDELKESVTKSRLVGRWFASSGTPSTIMTLWRIKP